MLFNWRWNTYMTERCVFLKENSDNVSIFLLLLCVHYEIAHLFCQVEDASGRENSCHRGREKRSRANRKCPREENFLSTLTSIIKHYQFVVHICEKTKKTWLCDIEEDYSVGKRWSVNRGRKLLELYSGGTGRKKKTISPTAGFRILFVATTLVSSKGSPFLQSIKKDDRRRKKGKEIGFAST